MRSDFMCNIMHYADIYFKLALTKGNVPKMKTKKQQNKTKNTHKYKGEIISSF